MQRSELVTYDIAAYPIYQHHYNMKGTCLMYSVYTLSDPRTNEVRYVGCTLDVKRRFNDHMRNQEGNSRKRAWIDELKAQGLQPVLFVLEDELKEAEAFNHEAYWIVQYRDHGASLLNYQHAQPGVPYREHKRHISSYVVYSKKQYEYYKSLGRNVELRRFS